MGRGPCKILRGRRYTWAMTDVKLEASGEAAESRPAPLPAPPLSGYGLIGDMRTAALVGLDGAIDWCCLPRFDSGSVFAALLDPERGGTWAIRPEGEWTSVQRYLPRTNILETTFRTADGVVVLTDFMPVDEDGRPSGPHPEIHRQIRCTRGRVPIRLTFMPRFEYGARATRLEVLRNGLFATDRTDQVLTLSSARPFEWNVEQSTASARFTLEKGEQCWTVLRYDDDDIHPVDRYESAQKLDITAPSKPGIYPYVCTYPGHWRRMYGALYVVEDLDEYLADAEGYLAKHPLPVADELLKFNRPRKEWKLEELAAGVEHLHGRSYSNGKQMFQVANCLACATRAAATCKSCTASTAGAIWSSASSITWPATRAHGRSGWETALWASSSSTSTARCSRPRTSGAATTR